MEQHYRNANIRVAITAEMINRMVGAERSESRPIRDRIAGAFVRGQSDIPSESRVELAPAERRMAIEGPDQAAWSNPTRWPTPARSASAAVGRPISPAANRSIVDSDGVRLQPSDVEATSRNRLVGVTTDYDWVPLFGGYARDRAKQEYQARQNRARSEMESRVSFEASDTLDRETHEAMERARQESVRSLHRPLRSNTASS